MKTLARPYDGDRRLPSIRSVKRTIGVLARALVVLALLSSLLAASASAVVAAPECAPVTPGGSGSTGGCSPQPIATQTVVTHRLASVLRSGLVIRYSVNEQVAGRFEVLLASKVARRIGLHLPAASGLAKGTTAQTIIAKAILVTTAGGRGTYRIKFSKPAAARLRKLRKVRLKIRMVVHNASSPVATTVLDTVTLR